MAKRKPSLKTTVNGLAREAYKNAMLKGHTHAQAKKIAIDRVQSIFNEVSGTIAPKKNPRRKRNARKAINATAYVICVRVNKQTGYFTGTGFDTAKGRARMYRTQTDALKIGQQLADKYRTPVNVKKITVTVVRKRNPARAGVPQIISGRETFKDTARAAKLFKDFTGEKPGHRERIKIPNLPKVAMAVGSLDGIDYTTVRDGVTERYHHPFKRDARPALAVSPSGKQLLIVGGRYTFTDRGIEDG